MQYHHKTHFQLLYTHNVIMIQKSNLTAISSPDSTPHASKYCMFKIIIIKNNNYYHCY